jgi:hypothetical protein
VKRVTIFEMDKGATWTLWFDFIPRVGEEIRFSSRSVVVKAVYHFADTGLASLAVVSK